ncbi:MAG: cyclic nucleotide-binding domain-containing protein [Anaerolineales bacterium]
MTISTEERVQFLRQRPMFQEIEDEWLYQIAGRMKEFTRKSGELVFSEGEKGTVFYLIYDGLVRVWTVEDKQERELEILETGDKFGDDALLTGNRRNASITAVEDSTFLALHVQDFDWVLDNFPEVESYLVTLMESRQQARAMYFPWLHQEEVVYIITRRHPIRLWIELLKPAAVMAVSGLVLYLASRTAVEIVPYIIGFTLLFISILWAIWEIIDWGNDYFILTNQRIVWLEQVLFSAASRREAPLSAVQSVDVQTTQLGRIFHYGNVVVRTFTGTGSLLLTNVDKPKQFKGEIEELLIRVRQKTQVVEDKRLRQAIRESLGIDGKSVKDPVFRAAAPEEEHHPKWALLRTREVSADGRTITYHRHWWVLLMKTWLPLLGVVGLIALWVYTMLNSYVLLGFNLPVLSFYLVWFVALFTMAGILAYHFQDWKNDIYMINKDDMLIDSEKKPFGEEVSRSAPIKNIISLEHNRKGILRLLLNFGMVRVVVADATLTFYDVHNPAQVQQDIYYRQEQIKLKAEQANKRDDQEHFSKWLRAYHEVWEEEQRHKDTRYMADEIDDDFDDFDIDLEDF